MLASLKKNGIKLKYKVRNSKKKLSNKKTHEVQLHVRVYTYDFRQCCHRQLKYFTDI
jgi:uncharacterized protein YcfL